MITHQKFFFNFVCTPNFHIANTYLNQNKNLVEHLKTILKGKNKKKIRRILLTIFVVQNKTNPVICCFCLMLVFFREISQTLLLINQLTQLAIVRNNGLEYFLENISILVHFHKIFKPKLFGVLATIDIGASQRKLLIKTTM